MPDESSNTLPALAIVPVARVESPEITKLPPGLEIRRAVDEDGEPVSVVDIESKKLMQSKTIQWAVGGGSALLAGIVAKIFEMSGDDKTSVQQLMSVVVFGIVQLVMVLKVVQHRKNSKSIIVKQAKQ